ncbi:MAG TPA: DUF3108 domain-containing protein [Ignavibacteriaceae bacterium]|nr:DUF3108 domain-containing protein [Ignavibacteriaceae bacterium]
MKNYFLIFLFIPFAFSGNSPKQQEIQKKNKLAPKSILVGEELTYVVKYSVMRLGEIKIKVTDKTVIDGKNYYSAVISINSYPSVPFVSLHQVYKTKMTPDYYSDYFKGSIKHDDYKAITEYFFDYDNKQVRIRKSRTDSAGYKIDSTTTVNKKYVDGLSILFYAMMNVGQNKNDKVPTFINEKKEITEINFENTTEDISIDPVDYDIDCVYLSGEVHFISIFGLTGEFEGWFSNDFAAIPIKAKMKVLIGNITLELESWKMAGWTPPKYKD